MAQQRSSGSDVAAERTTSPHALFSASDIEEVARLAPIRRFHEGEALPSLGSPGGDVFVLVRHGRLLFTRTSEHGRRIATVVIYPGDAFLKLIASDAGTTEGRAQEASSAHVLDRDVLFRLVMTRPSFAWSLTQMQARYVEVLEGKLELQAFSSLPARVASLLLRLQDRGQDIRLSHGTLAEGVGATREAVTRTLDAFSRQGLVVLSRNHVTISDAAGLTRVASERHE